MTDKPKRPEFNLHKTPPYGKIGGFCIYKDPQGYVSVRMGDYVVLEGITASDACDLATLLLGVTQQRYEPLEQARRNQAMNRPICACQVGGWGLGGPPNPFPRGL